MAERHHLRIEAVLGSTGEKDSRRGAGLHDGLLAATPGVQLAGIRRFCRPEGPIVFIETAHDAHALEAAWEAPRHVERDVAAKGETAQAPFVARQWNFE